MKTTDFGVCIECKNIIPKDKWLEHLERCGCGPCIVEMTNLDKYFDEFEPTNENCLKGMICPECGSEGSFRIEVKTVMEFDDGGESLDDDGDEREWDEDSYIRCTKCNAVGNVGEFQLEDTPC
jgi:hypothetical protein